MSLEALAERLDVVDLQVFFTAALPMENPTAVPIENPTAVPIENPTAAVN